MEMKIFILVAERYRKTGTHKSAKEEKKYGRINT